VRNIERMNERRKGTGTGRERERGGCKGGLEEGRLFHNHLSFDLFVECDLFL
tara:strand:- start:491 stop:646 length:156 start_codon:yes stop_codon:yes gene_type:complete